MLHLRCLTGFWICFYLRLRSLKFYLFSRNTNLVIKNRFPYQFEKLFTAVIRTRSCDSIITMSIIFNNYNTINSWRSQQRAFLLCFILKIILHNLVFHDIWVKSQDFKKELALTLFRSLVFQQYLHTRLHICSGF